MKSLVISICFLFCIENMQGQTITIEQVNDHINDSVRICGTITSAFYFKDQMNKPTYLNMASPDSTKKLSIVMYASLRNKLEALPEILFLNKNICVNGKIFLYRGKPLIIIRNKDQIQLSE